jgi:hypothetical protein
MITYQGEHLFLGEIVEFVNHEYGLCCGKLVKFMVEV